MRIDARFCGPPEIANGGYLAGRLAAQLRPAARVRFRAPTPLDRELQPVECDDGTLELRCDGETLASAKPVEVPTLELPALPDRARVAEAAGSCRALETHPFPGCFVCGPDRARDGLGIFPGWLDGERVAAALWAPNPEWGDASGSVEPAVLWAALDCPSAFPLLEAPERRALEPMVLGELTAAIVAPLAVSRAALIVAWEIALAEGRGHSGVAIFDRADRLSAVARATWVSLAPRSA